MTARRSPLARRDEQGVTLVLVAVAMMVLLIFAAFTIDIGLAHLERRQDQSAADASATSGGVVALTGGSLQAVVNEVLAKVTADVDRTVTNQQWTACQDSGNLGTTGGHTAQSLGLTPATVCISWNDAFSEMRVRLPSQTVQTYFARVIGVPSFRISAFAHIEFESFLGPGGALPFVALAGAGAGNHICLRTSSNPNNPPPAQMVGNGIGVPASPGVSPVNADPCDEAVYDPASSTFGTLIPADYQGNCDVQNENVRAAIMVGTDHPTGYFGDPTDNNPPPFTIPVNGTSSDAEASRQSTYGDVRRDGPTTGPAASRCTTAMPNTIKMNPGLSASDLRCATISDAGTTCDGLTPRLRQVSPLPSEAPFLNEQFDNTPPWAYLSSSSNLPQTCRDLRAAHEANNSAWDFYDRQEAFLSCLSLWTAGASSFDDLFTASIADSPRLAYVPQIAERRLCDSQNPAANCQPALDWAHINSYLPVFLYRLYASNGNQTSPCDTLDTRSHNWAMHEPGQRGGQFTFINGCGGTHSQTKVDRLSGIVLDCRSLPTSVCDESLLPGVGGSNGVRTIFNVLLSR